MAKVSLEVPAALVAPVRETLVLLYGATAEALHHALRAHAEGLGPIEGAAAHRERLRELGALLDRLGWAPAEADEPIEVEAPREILHDALYGALIDAGERLAVACDGCWRGELPLERVEEAGGEVVALDGLLRELGE